MLYPPFPLIISTPDGASCPAVLVAPGSKPVLSYPADKLHWGVVVKMAAATGRENDPLLKCQMALDLASQPDWAIPHTQHASELCRWVIATGEAIARLMEPDDWPKHIRNACDAYLYRISHVINGAEEIAPLLQAIANDPNEQALYTHPFFDRAAAISTGAVLLAKVFLQPLGLSHMIAEVGPAKFAVSKQLLDYPWQLNFAEDFAFAGNHVSEDANGPGTKRRMVAFEREWARFHSPKGGEKEFRLRVRKAERRLKKVVAKLAEAGEHEKAARFTAIARYLVPACGRLVRWTLACNQSWRRGMEQHQAAAN